MRTIMELKDENRKNVKSKKSEEISSREPLQIF